MCLVFYMCLPQKLRERLTEKQEPLVGSVMRCVDEGMAHHFIENHKMSDLSVDATLALIGLAGKGVDNSELSRINISPDDSNEFLYTGLGMPRAISEPFSPQSVTPRGRLPPGGQGLGSDDELFMKKFGEFVESDEDPGSRIPKAPWGSGKGFVITKNKSYQNQINGLQQNKSSAVAHDNITQKEISMRAFTASQLGDRGKIDRKISTSSDEDRTKRRVNNLLSFYKHNDELPQLVARTVPVDDFIVADSLNKRLIITDKEINLVKSVIASRRRSSVKPALVRTSKIKSSSSSSLLSGNLPCTDPTFMTTNEMEADTLIETEIEVGDDPSTPISSQVELQQLQVEVVVKMESSDFDDAIGSSSSDTKLTSNTKHTNITNITTYLNESRSSMGSPTIGTTGRQLIDSIDERELCDLSNSDSSVSSVSVQQLIVPMHVVEDNPIMIPLDKNHLILPAYHKRSIEMAVASGPRAPSNSNIGEDMISMISIIFTETCH